MNNKAQNLNDVKVGDILINDDSGDTCLIQVVRITNRQIIGIQPSRPHLEYRYWKDGGRKIPDDGMYHIIRRPKEGEVDRIRKRNIARNQASRLSRAPWCSMSEECVSEIYELLTQHYDVTCDDHGVYHFVLKTKKAVNESKSG